MGDEEYRALLHKADAFADTCTTRAADALSCRSGCDACCHTWLGVSPVEADAVRSHLATLSAQTRANIAARGRDELTREQRGESPPRCAMLSLEGRCEIYPARPLICRTQGLALRYAAGTLPPESVRFVGGDGSDVTTCPLNYTERAPRPDELLNAEVLETLLGVVNLRHAARVGTDAQVRESLSVIAAEPPREE